MKLRFYTRDYMKKKREQREHEVLFTDLSHNDVMDIAVVDKYFFDDDIFIVNDWPIRVSDPLLAEALRCLTPRKQEVMLLSSFMEMKDREVAKLLKLAENTVSKHRRESLVVFRELYGVKL